MILTCPLPAFLFTLAGSDATEIFEDIGHSSDAKKELKKHRIGILKLSEEEQLKLKEDTAATSTKALGGGVGFAPTMSVVLLAIAIGYYYTWMR